MNMKKLNVTLAILVAAVMAGHAATATSDVVGYQQVAAAKGYTTLGFPLVNSPVVSATVSSIFYLRNVICSFNFFFFYLVWLN
jgi:hypothetical protein